MALPVVLEEIIKRLGDDFQPNAARREFILNRETWQLYLDLFELDNTKIQNLIEQHGGNEGEKYKLRQRLAAVFNYVPSLVKMSVNYLYSEQPQITIEDKALQRFIDNCDGSGTPLAQYMRNTVLPLALVLGMIDVLVQNPATPEGMFVTAADDVANATEVTPRVLTITPLQRINWSTLPTHEYNWIAFIDRDTEDENPFGKGFLVNPLGVAEEPEAATAPIEGSEVFRGQSFIRISRVLTVDDPANATNVIQIRPDDGSAVGFWVRSWMQEVDGKMQWFHDGGWLPTARVPLATFYYQRSIDPNTRHFGVSKIAMIAILTKKIIQLLSWTDEDVLANLALFVFPGNQPMKDGQPVEVELNPFKILYFGNDAKFAPGMLQGATSHIEIKLKLIDAYIREILRLAFLIGASAEAEKITSGVQAVVARNELFMELADLAGAADQFVLDLLALAKSWEQNADIDREGLQQFKPTVAFYKGPYTVDPLQAVVDATVSMLAIYDGVSPTMVKALLRQLAMTALVNEDNDREAVFAEIDQHLATTGVANAADVAAAQTVAGTDVTAVVAP